MKFLPLGRGNLQTLFEVPTMGVGELLNMFKIKKYHNTIMAKIAMLKIRSFVDHKLPVFTYFKRNFSPYTSQRCDQQKLSNLACSVKQRTGCENGTTRMLSVKHGSGQQTS